MTLRGAQPLTQHRGNRIVTPPSSEPVTESELRAYTVTDGTQLPNDDATAYIKTARQWVEDMTGLALITQTWRVSMDRWPTGREPWWDGVRQGAISEMTGANRIYELPRYPLISISGVTVYDDASNATAVVVADTFDVDAYSIPGRLSLQQGATWPVALRAVNAIEVTYLAGYGAASDVPEPLRRAVLQLAGFLFDYWGGCEMNGAYAKSGAKGLAEMYKAARL